MNRGIKLRGVILIIMVILFTGLSEGPGDVEFEDLLTDPEKFDGKMVRVVGFYYIRSPSSVLFSSKKAALKGDTKQSIWIRPDFETADGLPPVRKNRKWVRVVGVFRSGTLGIFDQYQGEITEIRNMEVVEMKSGNESPNRGDKTE